MFEDRPDQFLVHDPPSERVRHHEMEPLCVCSLPLVEPQDLLVKIAEQMLRRRPDIRSPERPL